MVMPDARQYDVALLGRGDIETTERCRIMVTGNINFLTVASSDDNEIGIAKPTLKRYNDLQRPLRGNFKLLRVNFQRFGITLLEIHTNYSIPFQSYLVLRAAYR